MRFANFSGSARRWRSRSAAAEAQIADASAPRGGRALKRFGQRPKTARGPRALPGNVQRALRSNPAASCSRCFCNSSGTTPPNESKNFCDRRSLFAIPQIEAKEFVNGIVIDVAAEIEIVRAPRQPPIGDSVRRRFPSQRSMIHFSTRMFSPKPGHRNFPSAPLRNQFTLKNQRRIGERVCRYRASAGNNRRCCIRRRAASPSDRAALAQPRRSRPRSFPKPWSRLNNAVFQSNAWKTSGMVSLRRPPKMIALIGTPSPFSTSGSSRDCCASAWRTGYWDAPLFL
jgi:hypothetical protein